MKVHIVDDDVSICSSLQWFLESVGIDSQYYNSAQEFLTHYNADSKGCILLDIRMHKMSGFELQEELVRRNNAIPIIFMTGHCDIHMAEHCKKRGAFEFIEKPFDFQVLIDFIERAYRANLEPPLS